MGGMDLQSWLGECCMRLKSWGGDKFGKNIGLLRKKLDGLRGCTDDELLVRVRVLDSQLKSLLD